MNTSLVIGGKVVILTSIVHFEQVNPGWVSGLNKGIYRPDAIPYLWSYYAISKSMAKMWCYSEGVANYALLKDRCVKYRRM